MAGGFLVSFLKRTVQMVFRVPKGVPYAVRQYIDFVSGKPPSEVFIRGLIAKGVLDPFVLKRALDDWQKQRIPVGVISAPPAVEPLGITFKMTDGMIEAVNYKRTIKVPYQSITGRPYHYIVEMIGERRVTLPDGTTERILETRYVTITWEKELTPREILGMAHERLDPDWRVEGTEFAGDFIGFGSIQPKVYQLPGS